MDTPQAEIYEADKSVKNQSKPWQFQPGVSGNPAGPAAGYTHKHKPFASGTITAQDIEALETLSKPQLINLIKKVSGAVWGIALKTDEEAYEAVRLKMLNSGLSEENIGKSLPALKEWLDRTKGKPIQRIDQKIDQRIVRADEKPTEMTNEQLLELLSKAGSMNLLPGGVTIDNGHVITNAEYEEVK